MSSPTAATRVGPPPLSKLLFTQTYFEADPTRHMADTWKTFQKLVLKETVVQQQGLKKGYCKTWPELSEQIASEAYKDTNNEIYGVLKTFCKEWKGDILTEDEALCFMLWARWDANLAKETFKARPNRFNFKNMCSGNPPAIMTANDTPDKAIDLTD